MNAHRLDQPRPDQQRDAEKYSHLVNALRRASKEIRKMEEDGDLQIDQFLERILPLFTKALDAEMAFAAKQLQSQSDLYSTLFEKRSSILEKELGNSAFQSNRNIAYPFEIMVAQPRSDLVKQKLYLSKKNFGDLVANGRPWVHSPFGDDPLILIPDLEPFRVTSAVIVRLSFVNDTYIVGVCNKEKSAMEQFLAADRDALDSIVNLIIGGARLNEQRLREIRAVSQFQRMISTLGVDPQRLDAASVPDTIVRHELESLYPHARAALQGIGIRTEDMLIVLYEPVEKMIRFALVYEAGEPVSADVIQEQEYYETRKLDERRDLVNWIIVNDNREILLLNKSDYAQWNTLHPEVDTLPSRSQSYLAAALIYRDKLIGVMALRDLQAEGTFTAHHKELLATIASQVAIVIGNAQLYEQARKQQREVERATNIAVMGAWEAEIGHDLNAEIGDLRGQLFEILDTPHELADIVRNKLHSIDHAIGRLALSEFTVPAPSIEQKPDGYEYPFLDEVLDAEIRHLQKKLREEGDDMQIEFTPTCGELRVVMDEWWIRKFVRHFVSNARKYCSPDRRLRVAIHTQVEDGYAKVRIRDNGKGIDPKIAAMLFKQLVPVDASRPGFSGGRGLALVGFVCERYRGAARLVQSDPQTGSEFEFTIPIADDY